MLIYFSWELHDPVLKRNIDMIEDLNQTFGLGILADFFPIFKYIPTPGERKLRKFNTYMKSFMMDVMREHRESYDPGKEFIILSN